ncbi:unnamed protein product, partial [Phaeothamnion confervicola]
MADRRQGGDASAHFSMTVVRTRGFLDPGDDSEEELSAAPGSLLGHYSISRGQSLPPSSRLRRPSADLNVNTTRSRSPSFTIPPPPREESPSPTGGRPSSSAFSSAAPWSPPQGDFYHSSGSGINSPPSLHSRPRAAAAAAGAAAAAIGGEDAAAERSAAKAGAEVAETMAALDLCHLAPED